MIAFSDSANDSMFAPYLSLLGGDASSQPAAGARPLNLAPYLTLFGGGWNASSQLAAGSATAGLQRANAQVASLEARSEAQTGAQQADLYRQHLQARMGAQRAATGGANIAMSGSALRGLATTAELGAQDISRIQVNAARKAWGYGVQQEGDLARAKLAEQQGVTGAIGGLITTGAKAYGQWNLGD